MENYSTLLLSLQILTLTTNRWFLLQFSWYYSIFNTYIVQFLFISAESNFRQSWTKVLTHLSKTNAFYRHPSVNSKNIFFVDSRSPDTPFQCCNTLRGHSHMVTTLKRGEGLEMSKLEIEKLMRLTKQVFFSECLNCFCQFMIVAKNWEYLSEFIISERCMLC